MLSDGKVWLVWIVIIVFVMSVEAITRAIKTHLRPQLWEVVSELIHLEKFLFPRVRNTQVYNVLEPEADEQWAARKPPSKKKTKVLEKTNRAMQTAHGQHMEELAWDANADASVKPEEDHKRALYTSLVGSILRFRKLTGASFASASTHSTETFDTSPEAHALADKFAKLRSVQKMMNEEQSLRRV